MEIMLKKYYSYHKNDMSDIIKQEGLYQNKVNSSLVFTYNRKMGNCLNG